MIFAKLKPHSQVNIVKPNPSVSLPSPSRSHLCLTPSSTPHPPFYPCRLCSLKAPGSLSPSVPFYMVFPQPGLTLLSLRSQQSHLFLQKALPPPKMGLDVSGPESRGPRAPIGTLITLACFLVCIPRPGCELTTNPPNLVRARWMSAESMSEQMNKES